MRIAACVRRVLDPEAPVRLAPDGSLDTVGAARLMDPVDAAALELAVQVAEEASGDVVAFTLTENEEDAEEALRTALAQGATGAVHIGGFEAESALEAGEELARAIGEEGPFDLVVTGWASSDQGGGGTAAVIAARLGWPVIQGLNGVPRISGGAAVAERRRDAGFRETVRVQLPAVVSVYRGAEPRFPTTPARLRARRAEIRRLPAGGNTDTSRRPADQRLRMPPPRLSGILVPLPGMDARDRLRFLVAGGQARSSASRIVRGSSEGAAALAQFVRERDLLRPEA